MIFSIMVYNSQKGRGINDLFGTLNRAFTPVLESVADVGANVATFKKSTPEET